MEREEHMTPMDEPSAEPTPELRRHLDRLPRELQPARDLWPAVAARMAHESRSETPPPTISPRWGARQWGLQAVAALFFMAVGAWLSGTVSLPSRASGSLPMDPPETRIRAASLAGESAGADPAVQELEALERDYRQARDALWLYLMEHEQSLPSGVLKVVETNIRIIDGAGAQILDALAHDPGNPELQRRLLDNRHRSLEILRNLSRRV